MNHEAPEGQIWICAACGKRSRDKYGYKKIDSGWDESCMMNSVLCYDDNRRPWVAVPDQAEPDAQDYVNELRDEWDKE